MLRLHYYIYVTKSLESMAETFNLKIYGNCTFGMAQCFMVLKKKLMFFRFKTLLFRCAQNFFENENANFRRPGTFTN